MQNPEARIQAGLELITSSFKEQQENYKKDLKKQQAAIDNITKQKQNLEIQNTKLLAKLAEMERAIVTLRQDNQNISNSYNNLSMRFATLKKNASQLEAFRKSIVSMIQNNPVNMGFQNIDLPDQQSDLDQSEYMEPQLNCNVYKGSEETSKDFTSQISSELVSEDINMAPAKSSMVKQLEAEALRLSQRTDRELSRETLRAAQTPSQTTLSSNDKNYDDQKKEFQDIEKSIYLGLGLTHDGSYLIDGNLNNDQSRFAENYDIPQDGLNANEDVLPTDFLEASKYKWEINERITKVLERSNTLNSLDQDTLRQFDITSKALQNRDATLDTAVLYKKIQNALTPGQFEDFASVIGSFNAGEISVNETITEIKTLITDSYLFDQMKTLIYEATK
ncbi:hypothetical protein HDV01_002892 [Terramyces sp. JEL0728]|nr:hypothetical protein HDV01_002892 [Terramyces sp. JEL0728]